MQPCGKEVVWWVERSGEPAGFFVGDCALPLGHEVECRPSYNKLIGTEVFEDPASRGPAVGSP